MIQAFLFCVVAPGRSTRGGRARRTAAGGRGLTVAGATVFASPGSGKPFSFILLPFFGVPRGVPLAGCRGSAPARFFLGYFPVFCVDIRHFFSITDCSLVQRIRGINGLVCGCIGFYAIFYSLVQRIRGINGLVCGCYWVSCHQLQSINILCSE